MKTRFKLAFIFCICLIPFFFGLAWLTIGLMILGGLYVLSSHVSWVLKLKKRFLVGAMMYMIAITVAGVLLRVFIFEIYTVPSQSMETTLFPGDKVLISKISYGPALPRSAREIPWLNIFFNLAKENTNAEWKYTRLSGLSKINRNDVVAFKKENKRTVFIKRIIGLPGDSIKIVDGHVVINQFYLLDPATAKQHYSIWINNFLAFKQLTDSLKIPLNIPKRRGGIRNVRATITVGEMKILKKLHFVDSLRLVVDYPDRWKTNFTEPSFNWTFDNLGPILLPESGMTICLTKENFATYKKILDLYEDAHFLESEGRFFYRGKPVKTYTFKQNYYFVMGDNRIDSQDSRYWGLIPEEGILGKATCILFSSSDLEPEQNRIMKLL